MATYSSNKTQKIVGWSVNATHTTNGDHVLYQATSEEEIEIDVVKITGNSNYILSIKDPDNVDYAIINSVNGPTPNISDEAHSSFNNAFSTSRNKLDKLRIPPNFKLVLNISTAPLTRTVIAYGKKTVNTP